MYGNGNNYKWDADEVTRIAQGRWDDIYSALCPNLHQALKTPGKHVSCPHHNSVHGDGFRFYRDFKESGGCVCNTCGSFYGFNTIMWDQNVKFAEALDMVATYLGMDPKNSFDENRVKVGSNYVNTKTPEEIEAEKQALLRWEKEKAETLRRVWKQSIPLTDPIAEPARLYLARRGLSLRYALAAKVMRFHPRMGYYESKKLVGYYPAILTMVYAPDASGNWKPKTIHRIYLNEEGYKADVSSAKKMMGYDKTSGSVTGGGAPLVDLNKCLHNYICPDTGESLTALAVTEGIETALAVIEASNGKLPVWPCINSTVLEGFQPPPAVDVLLIYGDQDKSNAGKEAALALKEKINGENPNIKVFVLLPPPTLLEEDGKSVDWLDMFIMYGSEGVIMPNLIAK